LAEFKRRFAIGAEPVGQRGVHFRVWAPAAKRLELVERVLDSERAGPSHLLEAKPEGYFEGLVAGLGPGALYSLRVDGGAKLYPDPASRFQPSGPHGPSEVVDSQSYAWRHANFPGAPSRGQVLYELHVGTFTREGTYAAAMRELPELRALGLTTLELMPLAEFPGRFGWGYDGVDLWSPTHLYGRPDELRAFIDAAHGHGLAVILDVVYNHLGPDGNYLKCFSPHYFSDRYENEWGEALNFDGPQSAPVREFFCENARYWIEEYRFDGLRLDATQTILDASPRHVLADLTERARAAGRAQGRNIYISAENEPQDSRLVGPAETGGYGCDALWNDDFHHAARVALTGRHEAYYADYRGSAQELISAVKWGFLYQGQHYAWQKKRRGRPALGLPARHLVSYLQNHDQIANSLRGDRIGRLTSAAELRALTTLWLLAPPTPLLFQGQEFDASTPFLYFADHEPELRRKVAEGRRRFLDQFQAVHTSQATFSLDDPGDPTTFERCKLDFSERERHGATYALHRELLALRREDPAFSAERSDAMHGAVLGERALVLRFCCDAGDRLLVLNLGSDLELEPAPEPLLAPPAGHDWKVLLSSEDTRYGGQGSRAPYLDGKWSLTAHAAHVLCGEKTV
jgi:maltooligosyltrehalose trehalohydrolase